MSLRKRLKVKAEGGLMDWWMNAWPHTSDPELRRLWTGGPIGVLKEKSLAVMRGHQRSHHSAPQPKDRPDISAEVKRSVRFLLAETAHVLAAVEPARPPQQKQHERGPCVEVAPSE